MSRLDYKQAGVDVEAGDALVDWLQEQKGPAPHQDKIVSGIGGFAALFKFPMHEYKKPLLVSCTDGVGTKVKLAAQFQDYSTVGQDLVAMCVNDMVCCGAQPLFFLDYYATGKLRLAAAQEFLASVRAACAASDCALIGGETAEMPGVYHDHDFDCAGFSVGVVEQDQTLGPDRVRVGSRVLGVASNGFHSNGFSLLRKVFAQDIDAWRETLLKPTHLYVRLVRQLYASGALQAVAHITGGGMENIPRVLPAGVQLELRDWRWPAEFLEVQERTGMSRVEMLKTLNCGVGLVLVVAPERQTECEKACAKAGFACYELGEVSAGKPGAPAEILY